MGEILKLDTSAANTDDAEPNLPDFSDFWALYPRREAKKDAQKAWEKIDPALHAKILEALYHWRIAWRRRETHYIALPASWLNGERWEDELPAGEKPQHVSQVAATPADPGERTPMPQYVRDLIAKLKK